MFAGVSMTGAARLAVEGAMRIGAGVGIVVAEPHTADILRAALPAHVIVENRTHSIDAHISELRRKAFLIGCGLGSGEPQRKDVLELLRIRRSTVLDAEALTSFEMEPETLYPLLHQDVILTPHEGEFSRIFPHLSGTREERATKAVALIGRGVLVLKGPRTLVASCTQGRVQLFENNVESPHLATAGSGDVLAGMILGLLAQGMPSSMAACAAVHLHARAGALFGRGLVASDLPDCLPEVFRQLGV